MKKKRITKTEQILNHLLENGHITSWEAIQEYGATRLSAIIFNLKEKGYNIISEIRKGTDNNGNSYHFAIYHLNDGYVG